MQRLGNYEILEEIARGGMGAVYRARHDDLPREVALKVMLRPGASPQQRKRFLREASAVSGLEHPNIVSVWDLGEAGDRLYMVMDLVAGGSLQERLDREGCLSPDEAVRVLRPIADALAHAHARGVLHRDLKPDNILLGPRGPLLTDFGLTRDLDPSLSQTRLTMPGRFLGTPGYWAPEQARGELERIGPATDVYGLGATLFALLTGRPPGGTENLLEAVRSLEQQAPAPSASNPAVPGWLDRVVARALAPAPEDRFGSALELAQALSEPDAVAAPRRTGAAQLLTAILAVSAVAVAVGILAERAAVDAPRREPAARPGRAAPSTEPPGVEAPATARGPERQRERAGQDESEQIAVAEEMREAGQLGEALALYDRVIERGASARAYVGRGTLRDELGDPEGAIADYSEAIQLEPDNAKAFYNRAVSRQELNDHRRALEDYTEAIRLGLEPGLQHCYHNRANARMWLGDLRGQIEDCSEAIRLQPDFARAYVSRGTARSQLGDWEGALQDYSAAIAADPSDVKAHHNRGSARTQLGDPRGAIADYSEAIRLDPQAADSYLARGNLRQELGDFAGGVEDCSRVLQLRPDDAKALAVRGLAHFRAGRAEEAVPDWERALALQPQAEWAAGVRQALETARRSR